MQITIYLADELIDRVEDLAKKEEKSRSSLIQEILAEGLQRRGSGTAATEILKFFGGWKMTGAEIKEIRRIQGKDARRAKLS